MTTTRKFYGLDEMRLFNARLDELVGEQVMEVFCFVDHSGPERNHYGYPSDRSRHETRIATVVSVERKIDKRDEDPMYWQSWEECLLDNGAIYRRNYQLERWHADGWDFGKDPIKDISEVAVTADGRANLRYADIYPLDADHDEYLRRKLIAGRTKEISGWIQCNKMSNDDVARIEETLEHLMHVHGRVETPGSSAVSYTTGP